MTLYMLETISWKDKYEYTYVTADSKKAAIKKANLKLDVINVYAESKEELKLITKKLSKKLAKATLLLESLQANEDINKKLLKKYTKKVNKAQALYNLVKKEII